MSTPTPGQAGNETNFFFPPADNSAAVTDRVAGHNDGLHILGATVTGGATLQDLKVAIAGVTPATISGTTPGVACPASGAGLKFLSTYTSVHLGVAATAITGVLPTSDSSLAFMTYTGASGLLPEYAPQSGTISYIPLSGTATAPIAGVLSADNTILYVGTTGDNLVHLITRNGSTATDTSAVAPNLVAAPGQSVSAGTAVPVNLIVQKPRKTT